MGKEKKQKQPLNKAMRLSGAGIQMLVTILLFNWFGEWLDVKFNKTFLETTLTLCGIFASMYLLIRQVNKLDQ